MKRAWILASPGSKEQVELEGSSTYTLPNDSVKRIRAHVFVLRCNWFCQFAVEVSYCRSRGSIIICVHILEFDEPICIAFYS